MRCTRGEMGSWVNIISYITLIARGAWENTLQLRSRVDYSRCAHVYVRMSHDLCVYVCVCVYVHVRVYKWVYTSVGIYKLCVCVCD